MPYGQDKLLGKWTATVDQAFLGFYIMELVLKALCHLQRTVQSQGDLTRRGPRGFERSLLCGHCSVVWWNWLDLVIVVSGLIVARLRPQTHWALASR